MPDARRVRLSRRIRAARLLPTTPAIDVPFNQDLVTLLRSRTPLILVESGEESRVVEAFRHAITQSLRPLYRWSITDGLQRLDLDVDDGHEARPTRASRCTRSRQRRQPGVYLLLDFQPYLGYPRRCACCAKSCSARLRGAHVVLVGTGSICRPSLASTDRYELALPDANALAAMVREDAFAIHRENDGRASTSTPKRRAPSCATCKGSASKPRGASSAS